MTAAPTKWRLLRTYPANGAWNMAVDEAILESSLRSAVPPTMRLYGWDPPCISIGYAQSSRDVNFSYLEEKGWQLVRRPTGGRAILHTNELTYSLIGVSTQPQFQGNVLETYQRLSTGLLEALRLLGVEPDPPQKSELTDTESIQNPVCFEVPSNYEITVGGKKLIGSAQARRKSGFLQHGSLPLHGDITRIIDVIKFSKDTEINEARQRLSDHATTLEEVLGYRRDWWLATYAFKDAFQKSLKINLQEMRLTPAEGARAYKLYMEKYNNPSWTLNK
jgi:lipoate-protein ligase A